MASASPCGWVGLLLGQVLGPSRPCRGARRAPSWAAFFTSSSDLPCAFGHLGERLAVAQLGEELVHRDAEALATASRTPPGPPGPCSPGPWELESGSADAGSAAGRAPGPPSTPAGALVVLLDLVRLLLGQSAVLHRLVERASSCVASALASASFSSPRAHAEALRGVAQDGALVLVPVVAARGERSAAPPPTRAAATPPISDRSRSCPHPPASRFACSAHHLQLERHGGSGTKPSRRAAVRRRRGRPERWSQWEWCGSWWWTTTERCATRCAAPSPSAATRWSRPRGASRA